MLKKLIHISSGKGLIGEMKNSEFGTRERCCNNLAIHRTDILNLNILYYISEFLKSCQKFAFKEFGRDGGACGS